jgi:hypothetical protein
MKLHFKRTMTLTFTACLLLLGSCGKKNTVNTTISGTSPFNSNNPALNSGAGSSMISQYNDIKSKTACLRGARLANDVSFYINGGGVSLNTIGGNWMPGILSSGTITNMYVGVSAYRDLMFVTKVTDGTKVLGYNVTLSFCEIPNAYPNFPALVSNDRPLANFNAPYGITLDQSTNCGFGVVNAAINTVIVSKANPSNPYTGDFPVYTSFSRPLCNGSF